MSFSDIQGQAEAVAFLQGALRRQRIPSAYLFLGPHHVGKRTTAETLAQALNCRDEAARAAADACGACPSCRKIAEGLHPDVETIRPDGQFLRIDQVREVADRLTLIPFEARKRVVILAQAERMNPPAANAFLKTLEEPPADTLIVLCAEDARRLPETIVSRCVPVRFRLLTAAITRALLSAGGSLDDAGLDFALRFAQGRLRPELPEKTARWIKLREDLIHSLTGLHRPMFAQLSDEVARWAGSDDWRFVLEWLESWFRDLALHAEGVQPEGLVNGDRPDELAQCAQWFTTERALRAHHAVLETRDALAMNANKALALEALWLGFKA
ncbi:MAG TPA: DNA polymerase III subunit delta' [bacterium]|nr:DNA polymerase III subunit delta' [bacterium]